MQRLWKPLPSVLVLSLTILVSACGDDVGGRAPSDAALTDAAPSRAGTSEAGTGTDTGGEAGQTPQALDASAQVSGIAVVSSDYKSSAISLFDRDGNLLGDACFNSGSKQLGLTMALSGDVVFPSQASTGGPILVVDRGNSVLTWLDPSTCAPLRQLDVGNSFGGDPHDVVVLSATKAYVTRAAENGNPTPLASDYDEGDDVLVIDPSQPKIMGRIDLKPFAPDGVLPRADRALLIDGKVYVSLNAISATYASYATGRIVVIDPQLDQVVSTIDLPNAKDCGAMAYVATGHRLLVACDGAYSDGAQQANTSGIVAVDLSANPPTATVQVSASSVGGTPFSFTALATLGANTAFAVTMGDYSNLPPDRLWSLPLDGNLPSKIFDSAEAYSLGGVGAVIVDADRQRLFLADGTTTSAALLRVFDLSSGTAKASKTLQSDPSGKLPPRALTLF